MERREEIRKGVLYFVCSSMEIERDEGEFLPGYIFSRTNTNAMQNAAHFPSSAQVKQNSMGRNYLIHFYLLYFLRDRRYSYTNECTQENYY
jgi:hypothetical protein